MNHADDHFTSDQLSAYLLGANPRSEADQISAHIGACPRCLAALDDLSQRTDPFQDRLRAISDSMDPAPAARAQVSAAVPVVPGYDVLGVIGRGGMGVVYRARQVGLNRLVALKMISAGAHASPEQQVRFHKEAAAVAQLQHPGIVQIFDIGSAAGLPYFAMELVDGKNLKDLIDGMPQNPRQSARRVVALAQAMHAAHDKGIVHRDLKPANVLVAMPPGEGPADTAPQTQADKSLKITDFGLARFVDEDGSLTRTGTLAGTPGFMAPEQLSAAATVDIRADVYALGAILYNLITGRPPFQADTPIETLKQVQQHEPIAPRSLNPTIDRDLETICLKCLEKDPSRRYPTARELADDLERFDNGEPIRARKTGPVGKVWRWAKRNGRLATVSAFLLLVLLAAAIGGPIVAFSFNALASAEQQAADEARSALLKAEQAEAQARAAAQKAEELQRRAELEAGVSKEVSKFLLGLFDDADPVAWSGRAFGVLSKTNPTAEEIVERGARHLAAHEELKAKPLVRAALLDRIGVIYVSLGDTAKGRPLLDEALALRRQHLPAPHKDLADSLESHANLHFAAGDFAKAESFLQEALDMRTLLFGPDSSAVADLNAQRGMVFLNSRKLREAEPAFQDALRVYRTLQAQPSPEGGAQAKESPWVFIVLAGLIFTYLDNNDVGSYAKAAPLVVELRQVAQRMPNQQLGQIVVHFIEAEQHRLTGQVLKNLSKDAAADSFKKSGQEFLLAFDLAKKVMKDDHYMVVSLQREYASLLMELDRFEEAEEVYVRVVAVYRKQFGNRQPDVLSQALYNCARCAARGRGATGATPELRLQAQKDAEAFSREAVTIDRRNPNRSVTNQATHLLFHGVLLQENLSAHSAEAEASLRQAMALRRKEYPPGSALNMHPFRALLGMFVDQKRYQDAEALMREEWKLSSTREWPKEWIPILYNCAEYSAKDKADRLALLLLAAAIEAGFRDAAALQTNPAFASIRPGEAFQRLLKNSN